MRTSQQFVGSFRSEMHPPLSNLDELAERQGFEPWVPLPGQLISSESDSAALAPLPKCRTAV